MSQRLKYNEHNINLVRCSIENLVKSSSEFNYGIKLDGLMIVPRTKDLSLFDSFREYVNEETRIVTFIFYYSEKSKGGDTVSMYCNDYVPTSNEYSAGNQNNPGLINLNSKSEAVKYLTYEVENVYLKKELSLYREENEKIKKDNLRQQKYILQVDGFIAELRARQSQVKDKGTLELITDIVSKVALMNPDLLKNPLLGTLAGTAGEKKQEQGPEIKPEQVTVKPKGENKTEDPEVLRLAMLVRELKRYYSPLEFEEILKLLNLLKDHKEMIKDTIQWLQVNIEWKKREMENLLKQKAENQANNNNKNQST